MTNSTDEHLWLDINPTPNDHQEHLQYGYPDIPYIGTMYNAKIMAEFAIDDPDSLPDFDVPGDPYEDDESYDESHFPCAYYIQALNHSELGWYCYTSVGGYYVPTWNLGDIAIGEIATILMEFEVTGGGMPSTDLRDS